MAPSDFLGIRELESYVELVQTLGKGEAACLTMAQARGWYVASDERRRFLRLARQRLGPGRILNTPGIFLLGIRAGPLSVQEADESKRRLEAHRFTMAFPSFADVLGEGPMGR